MRPEDSSDPLPFTQIDRAVKPKAATLAGAIGVSPQHAIGSLVEFWDLCGDQRDIAKLIQDGKTEVVLSGPDVSMRFALASGKTIAPEMLVAIGLLEPRGADYRVRGMSRYFRPIKRKIQLREAGSIGGQVNAAKATRINGKFAKTAATVVDGADVGVKVEHDSTIATGLIQAQTKQDSKHPPSISSSSDQPISQKLEVISVLKTSVAMKPATVRLHELMAVLEEDYENIRRSRYKHGGAKDTQAIKSLLPVATDTEIRRRWIRALEASANEWISCSTFAELGSSRKWNALIAPERQDFDPNQGIMR